MVACRCTQQELDKERQSRLQRYSGLEAKLLKNMTFDNFDWKGVNLLPEQRENLKEAFDTALYFAKSPEGWLVLAGVTGCGKTHLAAAIANYRLKEGKPAKFMVVPDFLDHLRSTFSPESTVTYDQLFEEVKKPPCSSWTTSASSQPLPGHRRSSIRLSTTAIMPGSPP